jgi:adenylate cyclase
VVCATTREVTDELIAYQEMPPVRVPGKSYPLDLFRALQPQQACAGVRQLCGAGAD